MSSPSSHILLGLFSLTGIGMILAFFLVLGSSLFFQEQELFETHVDQSVQGLEVGSPVKLLGVRVGVIRHIEFDLEVPARHLTQENTLVRIVMALSQDSFNLRSGSIASVIDDEVERGLRARLATVGLTGTAYLELDYLDPDLYPPQKLDRITLYPYIPSVKASFTRIIEATEELIVKLRSLDFEGISANLDTLVATATARLEEADIASVVESVNALAGELRDTNRRLQEGLASIPFDEISEGSTQLLERLNQMLGSPEVREALARISNVATRVDLWLEQNQGDLSDTAVLLRQTMEQLRQLGREAEQNPARFIWGRPPPPLEWAR